MKFSTVVSVAAAFALAPAGASAATVTAPPECSAPGAWTSMGGTLSSGEMTRMFLPATNVTRACLTVPDFLDFNLYLDRAPYGTTAWELVAYSKTLSKYEWFDAATDRYADGKLWAFRLRVVGVSGAGTYKLSWLGLCPDNGDRSAGLSPSARPVRRRG